MRESQYPCSLSRIGFEWEKLTWDSVSDLGGSEARSTIDTGV